MNKGDKLICIKPYIFRQKEYYTQGEEYEILITGTKTLYVKSNLYGGVWFRRYVVSIDYVDNRNLVEYFITYNEWLALEREKQMNNILDD